jgi:UDP-N-acetylglucosamine 2-epimerase
MKTVRIITVVGARPQFVKAAAVSRAIAAHNAAGSGPAVQEKIVHTGQHYDRNLSDVFFEELKIPQPALNLEVGSGPHGRQTAEILRKIEPVLVEQRPDWVLIYGDTNSTLAGALAGVKLHIPVAHVEAGLRSFNRRMPEEINRIVADCVSNLLLCPTRTAVENLSREHVAGAVHQVGDVMYDSVLFNTQLARRRSRILRTLALEEKSFYLATIHRAENTDDPARLAGIVEGLSRLPRPIVLPLHPRTRKTLGAGLSALGAQVRLIDPVPYLDMLMLESAARIILTDSGGVQKEAYWFNVPCVTLRDETEWVELVQIGCNRLAGADADAIIQAVNGFEEKKEQIFTQASRGDLYGDGNSAEQIVRLLATQRPLI